MTRKLRPGRRRDEILPSADADNPRLHLGTSSWSCKDWLGRLYTKGTKPSDFIVEYADHYGTVEIDSTFYGVPRQSTLEGWRDKTPEGFVFSAKAPQLITHEKFLDDCDEEVDHFLRSLSILGDKLGPLLFQFPYYAKRTGVTEDNFLDRLRKFVAKLPVDEFKFAVEVRNKNWINPYLYEILHDHNLTLALIDHPWMSSPAQLFKNGSVITGKFVYLRWLGDRRGIEKITKTWNETIVDREADLKRWVPHIKDVLDKQMDVFGYVNNHYAGYAPDDIEKLKKLLN